jgi:sulfur relay (sulfurtransferase) DsrF/TusC family protein
MAEKNLLVIIKSQPFTKLNYYEALRVGVGFWDHEVTILWRGEGVYATLKNADRTLTGQFFKELPGLDTELLVDEEDLAVRGFTSDDLVKGIQPVGKNVIRGIIGKTEASLVF